MSFPTALQFLLRSAESRRVDMPYQFDFFQRTRDVPAGKIVRRHAAEFADLQAARAFGISELGKENPSQELDGCRIYLDGVYKSTISIHSEARDEQRPSGWSWLQGPDER